MESFAHAALAEALRRDRGPVVAEVVAELYRRHPEWETRWGVAGRELTARDTAFHLEFLESAIRGQDESVFTRYSSWLASVLRSRDVPVSAAEESYDILVSVLAPRLAPSEREHADALLRRGRAALSEDAPVPGRRGPVSGAARELVVALVEADRRRVQAILQAELASARSLAVVGDTLLQPAMAELGALWQENRISVAQEHIATALLQTALARAVAAAAFGAPNGRRALFACVEGNHHEVGLRVVSDAFEQAGWDVRHLGADVPTRDLIAATRDMAPEVLALSLSLPQHVATARRLIEGVRSTLGVRAPRIVAGGLPLNEYPALAQVIGADETYPDAASLVGSRA